MSRIWSSSLVALVITLVSSASLPAQTTAAQAEAGKAKATQKAPKAVIPVFSFNEALLEAPAAEDPFLGTMGAEPLNELVARLEKARKDDAVKAVAVILGSTTMGTAQREELYKAFRKIRDDGKPVYAHADSLSFAGLALLASTSRISIAPVGDLFITGMYGEQLHLRRLLDKIHVVPDFQTCGAYKSAGEIFMRSEPSPEAEAMYNWLFDSVFDTYVKMIADGRGQKKETVRGWIDRGLYSAEEAARLGIVDAAEHRHEFLKHIKQKHGDEIELEPKYGKKERDTVDLSNPFTIFKLWAEALQPSKAAEGSAVAIVYVEGPIVPGKPQSSPFGSQGVAYSDPIRRALDKAADDDTVKGVVLRVNSPGGSAVASEIILQATRRVAEKKPFVVSMGDVAGSGGYYVACGADTIVADAATITASIGVVAGKLATNKMWESVGIDWHPIARGRNSGMLASGEVFTSEQKKNLQEWMNEVYEVFKGHVVAARGDRLKKPIDELAGGRVFTGQQALELGLVDQVGTLSDAVRAVAKKAGLKEGQYETRVIPRPKNFMEELFKELAGETDEEAPIRIESMPGWRTQPVWRAASELLSKLQPQRAAALRRALIQLEILQREAVSLMAPEVVIEFDR